MVLLSNHFKFCHSAAKQQISWDVSLWWICITFVWPSNSLKLTAPSSRLERHLHFASIRLCLALLFIISINQLLRCPPNYSPNKCILWNDYYHVWSWKLKGINETHHPSLQNFSATLYISGDLGLGVTISPAWLCILVLGWIDQKYNFLKLPTVYPERC